MRIKSQFFCVLCVVLSLAARPVQAAEEWPESSPSGILMDRVTDLANLDTLNGSTVADPATPARWRQAVFELRKAAEPRLDWPSARAAADQAKSEAGWNEVPLGLVWASYDRLEADQSFSTREVFTFAPLRENTYHGARVLFSLAPASRLTHQVQDIVVLQLDAGDGLGFRPFDPQSGLDVSYSTTGTKRLRLQAALADGRVLYAASSLDVKQLTTPEPSDTWPITASETFTGVAGSGQAYLYLAEGHATLTRPVVVVEGFDIDNSIDWPVLYDLLNRENLLEDLHAAGYDAVVLDFTEAVDTDFTAKLVDVYPDGRAFNVQEGALRMHYREGLEQNLRIQPGDIYTAHLDLHATSNFFGPGHRIRLEISSSNFPRWDRNLNTGGKNFDESEWVVAENVIHHSPDNPSYLVLPIVH